MAGQTVNTDLIGYVCTKPMHLGAGSNEGYTTVNEGAWAWCPVGHQAIAHEWAQISTPVPLDLARHAWRWGRMRSAFSST